VITTTDLGGGLFLFGGAGCNVLALRGDDGALLIDGGLAANAEALLRAVYTATGANKIDIRRAVEQLFGSKVESVRTSVAHGKVKRQGKYSGRRSDWKKAYVKLREGEKLPEILQGA